ncbi:PREDICTED: omega-conotoxin-like protein 1 [Wasmannia auropunctata]|uniref:omega-conotoxin-like protein 1 n=1 Tax=Wasmannia auropunctata TaxID=64793 RepID=UPI0005ED91B2|nr:PREDICTED: omega-conotoxin-like protein 1 [Wasmannia auropunctata]XP_011706927.1 PREDICTED: omega-conotoxin-like protein 1 [Wasmannia auropunctata]
MKFVIFTIFVMIAMTMVASEEKCSPLGQYCTQYSDCCRYTQCLTYAAKCVTKAGILVPGEDKRPLGPGPYPPNMPE